MLLRTFFSRFDRRARLPKGVRIYAVGDLHGCADLLAGAFDLIDADLARSRPEQAIQVFLGDYIDRGPDAKRTIDLLIDRGQRHETVFVRGNHEALLLRLLDDPKMLPNWIKLGGMTTLMSYGITISARDVLQRGREVSVALAAAIPSAHTDFLANLVPFFSCGDYFFVHAGVRPGVPLDKQSEEDLMWIREPFLSSDRDFGKVVVHGHTPSLEPEIRSHRINIDTGAYATGLLTVLSIQDDKVEFHSSSRSRPPRS
ncbi:metallophosphoesterase family protein [Bradyrhizobium sp. WSM471]|jgi:serine/threonine protein phosphatase 1|uniref:metallophosphoesterase family protein n=1 Tax=Bradyrhizobium sp. WSM471 TaxID=319017 RepID=UPI00024D2385|nr:MULTISPECIES: metallophosphoesterase family protein [Bradyrhizobium]EHR01458.1 diadenosine tetraphosphatase [Bradyrhizobium sp. WSM471]UFW43513.1 serine/threonine protein phosphatase [Bradyrhizobium canariense]